LTSPLFVRVLLLAALTAGLGVILHELMHRVVARRFGATAHFVAHDGMLVISILIAFSGFLFAAPGAVWHTGMLSKRQLGLIAAAGPITNLVLAGLTMGYSVNAILGVFNMLPFGPIDGAKVLNWSGVAFGALIGVAIVIAFGLPRLIPGLPSIF
jgi:Zn-dependent protease